MATYTVIQDIEAEDKFLGPLTLKQFIFGAGGVFFGYLSFFAISQGAAFLLAIFVPPALLGFFLAVPWSSEQPTEVWVLAKLRFRFKNQPRIWDQAGLEELVTITVPKKIEKQLTNGLDPTEVQSRLKALAETIDTRGWAVKNATLDQGSAQSYSQVGDRLINPLALPRAVPEVDINSYEDVLDDDTAVSENFNQMIQTSEGMRRQQSLDKMQRIRQGEPLGSDQQPVINFTPPPSGYNPFGANSNLDESLLSADLQNRRNRGNMVNNKLRTVSVNPMATEAQASQYPEPQSQSQPFDDSQLSSQTDDSAVAEITDEQAQAGMTKPVNPDILELAQNNDLNISTLARQAKRNDQNDNEVVISLR